MSGDLLQRALLQLPPEAAHGVALGALDALQWCRLGGFAAPEPPALPRRVCGLEFPNPIGLAAGLDKNADHVDALGALGFGFIEIGTVTPRPQPGNARPRLFRLPEHGALINRMGFNNKGVDHAVTRLRQRRYRGIVGVNIGKNRDTELSAALADYRYCLDRVHAVADYIVINISSPNTPGLRGLQTGTALGSLLGPLRERTTELDAANERRVPLFVKIAPDLEPGELDAMVDAALDYGIDGLVATNTTTDRNAVAGSRHADESGGLSGRPLLAPSTAALARLAERVAGRLPLIGVGGVSDGDGAHAKIDAGASLVQVYTGLIYEGPALVSHLVTALAAETSSA